MLLREFHSLKSRIYTLELSKQNITENGRLPHLVLLLRDDIRRHRIIDTTVGEWKLFDLKSKISPSDTSVCIEEHSPITNISIVTDGR